MRLSRCVVLFGACLFGPLVTLAAPPGKTNTLQEKQYTPPLAVVDPSSTQLPLQNSRPTPPQIMADTASRAPIPPSHGHASSPPIQIQPPPFGGLRVTDAEIARYNQTRSALTARPDLLARISHFRDPV